MKKIIAAFALGALAFAAGDIIARAARVVPTPDQLAWHRMELTAFIHFTVNTFTDREWGDGTEDPKIFNPTAFDAKQWVKVVKDGGFKMLILTAKHHDGFCLWPSRYTAHSVKNSPWRGGKADVVREVADACRAAGIRFGVYLSPWDRHEPSYGGPAYNEFYKNQLRELLTNYGEIAMVWLDGAKGKGEKAQQYDWAGYYRLIRELQPHCLIHSADDKDAEPLPPDVRAPDVRWIGNERGAARDSEWNVIPVMEPLLRMNPTVGDLGSRERLAGADKLIWYPAEADVSIRPGWFYHAKEDDRVKSVPELLDVYYNSVGKNSVLLLNVPPDRRGLIHETDAGRIREFRKALDTTFGNDLARSGKKTGALEYDFQQPVTFNVVMLQEDITKGQRVESFVVESKNGGGEWREIARGTTIGYKRLLRLNDMTADAVRVRVLESRLEAHVQNVGLFFAVPEYKGGQKLQF
jgi:alpha-L-fucosidase